MAISDDQVLIITDLVMKRHEGGRRQRSSIILSAESRSEVVQRFARCCLASHGTSGIHFAGSPESCAAEDSSAPMDNERVFRCCPVRGKADHKSSNFVTRRCLYLC